MFAQFTLPESRAVAAPLLQALPGGAGHDLLAALIDGLAVPDAPGPDQAPLLELARAGLVRFHSPRAGASVTLAAASPAFDWIPPDPAQPAARWVLSRFAYLHLIDGRLQLRNPRALCYLLLGDEAAMALVFRLTRGDADALAGQDPSLLRMLRLAGAIVPVDDSGISCEERDPAMRQWDFHDLLFHARSRFGRSEQAIGGTFRFKGVLAPQPAIKPHGWNAQVLALPVPDLAWLALHDLPLSAALEGRVSNRSHSPLPLSLEQLGHFLYRTVRNRYDYANDYGEFTSRPYPCGGANYEQEFYLTVNTCAGVPRGFYYYDPRRHCLCLVAAPCFEMEALLHDAWLATAMQCHPQILVTIASRFNRFNWKYSGMSYAAQLKNIGAVYQTMYLVATSMQIGACGLGTGNADRFARLTQLPYMEEGSIGEFMLGRPL